MLTDLQAREILRQVWPGAAGCAADNNSLTIAGAIGRSEGQYGAAFGGINNWGAIQTSDPAQGKEIDEYNPHKANPNIKAYVRIYPTPADGAHGLVRELVRRKGVQAAMKRGSWVDTATTMYDSGYYTTRTPVREDAIKQYTSWIKSAGDKIIAHTGIPIKVAAVGSGALLLVGAVATALYFRFRKVA